MKKILVPVDASGAALRALKQAIELARLSGGSLHIVHAHDEPDVHGELALYVNPERMAEFQKQHSETILARAEDELKGSGVPYTKEVLTGPIGRTISAHAERIGCDVIVMGRHGESAIADMLAGSIAMKVVHLSRLPVMLVK